MARARGGHDQAQAGSQLRERLARTGRDPADQRRLAITIFGIPLAIALLSSYILALLLAGVFVAYSVGGWTLSWFRPGADTPYARLGVGALIVSLLASLPGVGWLIQGAVLRPGLGGFALERRASLRHAHA